MVGGGGGPEARGGGAGDTRGNDVRHSDTGIFDREAARYDAWFDSEQGRAIFESEVLCLRQLSDGLPRPWLEVGVGTGRFAQALGMDLGVDPAAAALGYAEGRGVRALPGVGEALPFRDGQFGAVFVIVTICFADDPAALLREARRVVTEGGGVVLGIVPAESPWGRVYAKKSSSGHAFYSHARFFGLGGLDDLASSAGLHHERSESTLFQRPGGGPFETEPPRKGRHDGAGFVTALYRKAHQSPRGGDDG